MTLAPPPTPLEEGSTFEPPELDYIAQYVLGFPVHVAITIRLADRSGIDILAAEMAIESVVRVSGTSVTMERLDEPAAAITLSSRRSPYASKGELRIRRGERMRMMVDLADIGASSVPPGRYRVTVQYEDLPPAAFETVFREPAPAERAVLDGLRASHRAAGSWGEWSQTPPQQGEALPSVIDPNDPLRYNRVLKYLFFGPGELSSVSPSVLDPLGGFYAPEARLLRAELAHARGGPDFPIEEEALRRDHPGLVYLLERTIAHGSLYQWERSLRRA